MKDTLIMPIEQEKSDRVCGQVERFVIRRFWAMPNKWTFKIRPIADLIQRYVGNGKNWIDPFAGENSPAEIRNDINPKRNAEYNLPAVEFAQQLEGEFDGVLFDPPYSLTQLKQCYENIGSAMTLDDANKFPQNVKELIAPKIKYKGLAITFGWNSQGFGRNLGFKKIEIMLIAHGRSHNDTIVVVEQKIDGQYSLAL